MRFLAFIVYKGLKAFRILFSAAWGCSRISSFLGVSYITGPLDSCSKLEDKSQAKAFPRELKESAEEGIERSHCLLMEFKMIHLATPSAIKEIADKNFTCYSYAFPVSKR